MDSDLKIRTKDYALSVIRLFAELPKRTETQIIGRQLLRCGTSVGAQYREASRAKSNADFISKMEGSLQELEESEYWLELLAESGFVSEDAIGQHQKRNRRVKGNLCQHRPKHKSQIEKSEVVAYPLSLRLLPLGWSCLSFIPLPLSFSESFCPYPLKLVHDHVSTHRRVSGTGTSFEQRAAVERLEPLQYC